MSQVSARECVYTIYTKMPDVPLIYEEGDLLRELPRYL